jgi:hypothetical protein
VSHPEAPDGRPPEAERVTFRRSDFVALRRAARLGWHVPDEVKAEALWQAVKVLTGHASTPRDRLGAAKFLAAAERSDLALAALELARERHKAGLPDAPDAEPPRLEIPERDLRPAAADDGPQG